MFGDAPFSRVTAHVAWRADGQKVRSGQDLFSFQPERRSVVTRHSSRITTRTSALSGGFHDEVRA